MASRSRRLPLVLVVVLCVASVSVACRRKSSPEIPAPVAPITKSNERKPRKRKSDIAKQVKGRTPKRVSKGVRAVLKHRPHQFPPVPVGSGTLKATIAGVARSLPATLYRRGSFFLISGSLADVSLTLRLPSIAAGVYPVAGKDAEVGLRLTMKRSEPPYSARGKGIAVRIGRAGNKLDGTFSGTVRHGAKTVKVSTGSLNLRVNASRSDSPPPDQVVLPRGSKRVRPLGFKPESSGKK